MAEAIRDTAFCWKQDDGRYYCFLADRPRLDATGKTKQHALYNLRLKLERYEKNEQAAHA